MENRISKLQVRKFEITQSEDDEETKGKKKRRGKKDYVIYGTPIKYPNRIIGVPEREERGKGTESLFKEITADYFPKMGRDLGIQVHEANKLPYYFNENGLFPGHNETVKN